MSTKFYKVKKGLNVKPNTIAGNESGDLRTDSSDSNKLKYHNGSSEKTVQTSANTLSANKAVATDSNGDIESSTVTATELEYVSGVTSALQTQIDGKQDAGDFITALSGDVTASGPGSAAATIAAGAVTNSKVSSSAAIAYSKLNLSGSVVNADIGTSAAIARSKLDFGSGLVNADIATAAAIARSKVATGTANDVLINDSSGNLSSSTRLPAGNFPALTGDVNTSAGSLTTTLTTVNSNVGTFGSSSLVPVVTVNGKGLVTAISTSSVTAASAWNVVSKSSAYTAIANDYVVSTSSSWIVTLPTAVGISGQQIAVQHSGTSLTNIYTIHTTSSQTIIHAGILYTNADINTNGKFALYTSGEAIIFVSDGSNWQVVEHKSDTPWTSFVPTFVGMGTVSTTNLYWRRQGPDMKLTGYFQTGSVTGTTASLSLPGSMTIAAGFSLYNTTFCYPFGGMVGGGNGDSPRVMLGVSGNSILQFSLSTATGISGLVAQNGSTVMQSTEYQTIQTASIPITGWLP